MGKYDEYIIPWKERLRKEETQQQKKLSVAKKVANECAQLLVEQYGAKRVYLIGSLTRETVFHEMSDIDLVVEGLPSHCYITALTHIWDKLPEGLQVDLIPIEEAFDSIKWRVKREGVLLYEGE